MTRFLTPSDYAEFGMMMVAVNILQVFQDFSIDEAIVQNNRLNDKQLSKAFWIVLVLGVICFILFNLIYPIFHLFEIIPFPYYPSILLSIFYLFDGISNMMIGKAQIDLNFKLIAQAQIYSVIISSIIGLTLAYCGWGVYALVINFISRYTIQSSIIFFLQQWKPSIELEDIGVLKNFAIQRTFSRGINKIFDQLDILVISSLSSAIVVGGYIKAKSIQQQLVMMIQQITKNLFFSYFSKKSEHDLFKKSILMIGVMTLSISIIFYFTAELLFITFFGEIWRESGQLFSILSFLIFTQSIYIFSEIYLNAKGQITFTLKVNIIGKVLLLCCFGLFYFYGLMIFILGVVGVSLILGGVMLLKSLK
ncbi:hypothetical protein NH26_04000 [Flammeovirga pacifica]|uniref:Polysaccharide biosynthesis protein C-terminal domain-containing protein n=2 Tax=Flammeovirga pacifica TaxID=915059 RepID=A0A1S1YX52_FLAPC|nr:hypothetical protein NH26_04000 [Flammeovirga pacifica]